MQRKIDQCFGHEGTASYSIKNNVTVLLDKIETLSAETKKCESFNTDGNAWRQFEKKGNILAR